MNKQLILTFFSSFLCLAVGAGVPAGYYNSAEGKKAATLKTELHTIICQDTTHYLDYGSGAGKTWEGFYYTDRNTLTNAVIDMYSDSVRYFPNPNPNFTAFGSTIEIEHSVPKSWWGCDITHPDCPAKDLNHLYPADGKVNMSKNDNPLGVVTGTPTTNNGVSKVGPGVYDGYVGNVFEPADQYKGDFARAYFYMATAYEHYVYKWDTTKPENMMQNNRYPVLKPWALALLLQWHRQDPVSYKEVTRNDIVYGIQKNRNPYIDHPELVEYVWGNRTTIPYRLDGSISFPYLSWPTDNDTINLAKVYYLQAKDTTLNLRAMNLNGDLTLLLGGTNGADFSLDKTTITKAEAEAGTTIKLHFNARTIGNQSAILTITGGGISNVSLKLKAYSSDEFAALSASNTGTNNFTANWTPSIGASGYSINVYSLDKTGATTATTLLEEEFLLALPNTWTKEGYAENTSGTVRLASGTATGKITTPALDLSTATSTLTVRAKQYSNDTGAKLTATLDNQALAVWTTAVGNQDFTVDMPVSTSISKIALSAVTSKRVYVDYVKVVAQMPVYGPVSVSGYPKSLGNVLSYSVTGLQSAHSYYYTVTPLGNSGLASNQIAVQTNLNTATPTTHAAVWTQTVVPGGIQLSNLQPGTTIRLWTFSGTTLFAARATASHLFIPISAHGFYLLQVERDAVCKLAF
jgi:hypothetical protein